MAGGPYAIETELQARIESGNAFPTRPDMG